MKKNNIKSIVVLFAIMIFALSAFAPMVFAIDAPIEEYNSSKRVYVHDLASILTTDEEQTLIEVATYYCDDQNINVLFLTINDAKGYSTMEYSDDYMDALFAVTENNIAFVIDMDNRGYYINTMGAFIQSISDYEIEMALDAAESEMKRGDYADAMADMADYCLSEITGKSAALRNGFLNALIHGMTSTGVIVGLVAAGIVLVVLFINHNSVNKTPSATKYVSGSDYKINDKKEVQIRTYETVQRNYYKPKSSSSGGGSSHRSSSGRSHGGGGRSF
jgi:uncharacterized protein